MSTTEDTDPDLVRQVLEAAHGEYNRGILEGSPARVLAFYGKWAAPDFEEWGNPEGHVTDRAAMLALMEQVVASGSFGGDMVALEVTTSIAELDVEENSAVAVTTNNSRYRQSDTQGWYGAKDQEHEIESVGRWRETWVKTDRGWQLQVTQLMNSQTYVDGLLFAPQQAEDP